MSRNIDIDQLIDDSRDKKSDTDNSPRDLYDVSYASRYDVKVKLPQHNLPRDGVDAPVAYQLLHDELTLDGVPELNLASFVNTWVPDECKKLMVENLNKNLVDQDEYPAAQEIHERCVRMISGLWNAPKTETKPMGTATTGSSEAIMLGGMALKRRWQENMKAKGKDIHNPGPNIVMGAEAQVALEKFARYFEVEARLVPVTKESNYVMDPVTAMEYVDENTIGIFVILGSTYTGVFENVKAVSDLLDAYEEKTGNHVPIHVDAASGGFVAPFAYPELLWDFRLPRVQSINASGHKYGASLVGVGWIIWRGAEYLPKELIFELHYLGETDYSFNLNFSRPAHPIIGQMFNFLNLGYEGYRRIISADLIKARILSRALEGSGYFTLLTQIHIPVSTSGQMKVNLDADSAEFYEPGLPVVGFRLTDEIKAKYPNFKQAWIQSQLRGIGWIVPNYPLPPACEDTEILRVVVRESMSGDLLRKLITDIINVTQMLLSDEGPSPEMAKATAPKVKDAAHHHNNSHPGRSGKTHRSHHGHRGKGHAAVC